ncbi:MAG TPA: hypothetical protein VH142_13015 [Polyangiaceae bacterium]|jgi:hypothetical protein|nr:hypothetical protein [Polyangiaceae bacterium]
MSRTTVRSFAARAGVVLGLLATGCPLVRGAVNASPSLRWWLFSNFGAGKMCPEMLKRGAPLRLIPNGNAIGRFFPTACKSDVDDSSQTVTIHFSGTGYAWTPVAGRVGFSVATAVEYRPDFQMTEDSTYVWARTNRVVEGPTFAIGSVENPVVNWASQTPLGYLASTFGSQIISSELASGFTVVHSDNGDDFALGILTPPAKPPHPFKLSSNEHITLANESTEVRLQQVDFIGPLEVADNGQALFMRFKLAGPSVDMLIMQRSAADTWREGLQQGAPLAPPTVPPITSFVLAGNSEQTQSLRLPPGQYVIVVDNSDRVGSVAPPWNPLSVLGGGVVVLSYSIELGDAT